MKSNTKPTISFDTLCQIEEKVSLYKWKPDDVSYCIEDIKKHIEPNLKINLNFAIWLLQKEPTSETEKEARRYLMNLIDSCVEGD